MHEQTPKLTASPHDLFPDPRIEVFGLKIWNNLKSRDANLPPLIYLFSGELVRLLGTGYFDDVVRWKSERTTLSLALMGRTEYPDTLRFDTEMYIAGWTPSCPSGQWHFPDPRLKRVCASTRWCGESRGERLTKNRVDWRMSTEHKAPGPRESHCRFTIWMLLIWSTHPN